MKKVGLLGGTFDPIHRGHLQLAEAALKEFELDKVLFIVAANPPHKDVSALLPFQKRFEMAELACEKYPYFECSDIEEKLPSPTYTVNTLQALREKYPEVSFYFIIGEDAFIEIASWKQYKELLSTTFFILSCREPVNKSSVDIFLGQLGFEQQGNCWLHPDYQPIRKLKTTPEEISSTAIRNDCNSKDVLQKLLPEKVLHFIEKHSLYK